MRFFVSENQKFCNDCSKTVKQSLWASHLRTNLHKNNVKRSFNLDGVETIKSAFQQRIITYRIAATKIFINIQEFFVEIFPKIIHLMEQDLQRHTCIKLNLELFGYYFNPTNETHDVKSFNTPFQVICKSTDKQGTIDKMISIIDRKSDEMAEKDSGKKFGSKINKIF